MRQRRFRSIVPAALVFLGVTTHTVLAGAQTQGAGQPAAPRRISVTITKVKPDMVDAYHAIIRDELMPAQKKAGLPWRATYRPAIYGDAFTFIAVLPVANYAQFDQSSPVQKALGDRAAKFNQRTRQMILSRETIGQTVQPEFSIESGSMTHAPLILVQQRKLLPGRAVEFNQLLTSQILPAYRKVGITDFWMHATNFGAPLGRTSVRPIASFAELDSPSPLAKALGAEGAQKITQQLTAVTDTVETTVMRLVPELSYTTLKPMTSK